MNKTYVVIEEGRIFKDTFLVDVGASFDDVIRGTEERFPSFIVDSVERVYTTTKRNSGYQFRAQLISKENSSHDLRPVPVRHGVFGCVNCNTECSKGSEYVPQGQGCAKRTFDDEGSGLSDYVDSQYH